MSGIRNCQFKYRCEKQWKDLDDTGNPKIKHCSECERMVFAVDTEEQLVRRVLRNYCVAITPDLYERTVKAEARQQLARGRLLGAYSLDDSEVGSGKD